MPRYQAEIDSIRFWLRVEVENVSKEYWKVYSSYRRTAKSAGEKFKWKAGCRTRETKYGARLQWFYMQPVRKGEKPHYHVLVEDDAPTNARNPKRMSMLQPAEREMVMHYKPFAARLEELGQRIKRYDRIERAINASACGGYTGSTAKLQKRIEELDRIARSIIESAEEQGWRP